MGQNEMGLLCRTVGKHAHQMPRLMDEFHVRQVGRGIRPLPISTDGAVVGDTYLRYSSLLAAHDAVEIF